MAVAVVTRDEQIAVLDVQCDFAKLRALIILAGEGLEDAPDASILMKPMWLALSDLADLYGSRMDDLPGLYPIPEN